MGVEIKTGARTDAVDLKPEAIDAGTAAGIFYRQVAKYGDRVNLHHFRDGAWRHVTWNQMQEHVLAVAAGLLEAGVQPEEKVIIFSPNSLEWLICDLAIASVGAVSVPIYPSTIAQLAQQIAANSEAVLAIGADAETAGRLVLTEKLRRIVRIDADIQEWMSRSPNSEALAEIASRLQGISADQLATIIYTSGTTGEPKGVMLAHRNFVEVARRSVDRLQLTEADVGLSFLPYAHSFERLAVVVALVAGFEGWLSRGKDELADDLQAVRPTLMPCVPMIYEKMYRLVHEQAGKLSPRRQAIFRWALHVAERRLEAGRGGPLLALQHLLADRLVLKQIRQRLSGGNLRFFVSGGAPLSVYIERFFWAIGVPVLQGWGLTETAATVTVNTLAEHRFGTVGKPVRDVELKLAEDGEILVKTPGLMLGYFNNQQATNEVLQEGWFKTGDIGTIDGDGFLKITDRKKDLIKTAGGKYVAPQGIEAQLQNERYVERVVVIGDERPYVTALIVPNWGELQRDGMAGDPQQLAQDERVRQAIQERVNKINQGLDHFESIQYFAVLERDLSEEQGELTPTLKPKRRVVTNRYRELIESMYRGKQKPAREATTSVAGGSQHG